MAVHERWHSAHWLALSHGEKAACSHRVPASTDSASAIIASSVAVVVYSADVSASLLDLCRGRRGGKAALALAGRGNDAMS